MTGVAHEDAQPVVSDPESPWAYRPYRTLLGLWFGANLCAWLHEATSGWLMASLDGNALQVALLQAFASLPVLLLALPSGALTDLLDRRRVLAFAFAFMAVVSAALAVSLLAGWISPALLLVAAFALGISMSIRLPAYAALTQEVLPRVAVPRAIVWNGATMNASRTAGPVLAGALIAWLGPEYAYLANALILATLAFLLVRGRQPRAAASTLPSERLTGAIRVGLQFAAQTPAIRAVLVRSSTYFFCAVVQLALLPVVVRDQIGGGPNVYTTLFGMFGLGAVAVAVFIQRLNKRFTRDRLIVLGTCLQAASAGMFALSANAFVLSAAMFASGFAWLTVASAFSVTAQFALPAWVRGRGLATVQMAFMGGGAFGSFCWGQIAHVASLRTAFIVAAASGLAGLLFTRRYSLNRLAEEDLTPDRYWPEFSTPVPIAHDEGPVQIMVEYLIDPRKADAFVEVLQESRRLHLRVGAISWALFRDPARPERFVEQWIEETWAEFLRHRDRLTVAERNVRDAKRAFHIGSQPPVWTHLIAADRARRKPGEGDAVV